MSELFKKFVALLLGVALGAMAMLALSSTTITAGHGFAFTGERYIHLESDLSFV